MLVKSEPRDPTAMHAVALSHETPWRLSFSGAARAAGEPACGRGDAPAGPALASAIAADRETAIGRRIRRETVAGPVQPMASSLGCAHYLYVCACGFVQPRRVP